MSGPQPERGRDARSAVLLHGLGGRAQDVLAPLREAAPGRFFVAPERPGYGLTDSLTRDPGPIGQAHWLRWVIDAAGAGRPVIVAHSLAAGVALAFAALYPERMAGVVLIAPFCRPTRRALLRPHGMSDVGAHRARWLQGHATAHATTEREVQAFSRDMALCRKRVKQIATPICVLCEPDDGIRDLAWHVEWLNDWASHCAVHFLRAGRVANHAQPQATLDAIEILHAR
ncbi:MAG: hypothetical protein JWN07_115 [Hyphomicrobiales bacterium]|nr:hypothetical protein [Hyphomicrobiales bacterium]